jgi:vacuolar protein sorting-associated protein 54
LHDVLTAAAELAHSRASKVVGVRTDQHAQLALEDFIRMFNAAWAFVVDCEVLCQKMIVGLRGTMVVQVRAPFSRTALDAAHS